MARPIRLCQDKIPEAARLNRVQFETRRFQFRSSPPGRPWKVGTTGFKLDAVQTGRSSNWTQFKLDEVQTGRSSNWTQFKLDAVQTGRSSTWTQFRYCAGRMLSKTFSGAVQKYRQARPVRSKPPALPPPAAVPPSPL